MSDGWIQHGDSNQRDLVKMLLPARGVHFLVSNDKRAARAIAAELAVAVAGGELPSLQNGGGENFRFLRGFMNLPTGRPRAVCVVGATDMDHINIAAALRCVTTKLPIFVREDAKRDLARNGLGYKLRENGIALAIVALDLGEKEGLDLARRYGSFADERTILIVTKSEPPKNLLSHETRVMRIVDGMGEDYLALEVEGEAIESGWARDFSLDAVDMGDDRVAWIVRVESVSAYSPEATRSAPEPAQAEREAYAGTVVYAVGGGTFGLSPEEISSWPADTKFRSTPEAVVEAVREIGGRARVVVAIVEGSKADLGMERNRVRTAIEAAHLAGVCGVDVLRRKLRDVRELEGAA